MKILHAKRRTIRMTRRARIPGDGNTGGSYRGFVYFGKLMELHSSRELSTMHLPKRAPPRRKHRKKAVAIPLARCARLYRATGFASSWQGGLYHPPFAIPPVQGRCPVEPGGRAFAPSQPHQTRGLAPATRVTGVPPSPTLPEACLPGAPAQPCADWMPPCREDRT